MFNLAALTASRNIIGQMTLKQKMNGSNAVDWTTEKLPIPVGRCVMLFFSSRWIIAQKSQHQSLQHQKALVAPPQGRIEESLAESASETTSASNGMEGESCFWKYCERRIVCYSQCANHQCELNSRPANGRRRFAVCQVHRDQMECPKCWYA